jgi:predicted nucleotidyltransferase component of viral defense system
MDVMEKQDRNKRYATCKAFRIALQDRIKKLSKETGRDAAEIYREIAFDRFLARLDYEKWTLKGGYSLERRLSDTRFTKDIDLAVTDLKLFSSDKDEQRNLVIDKIAEDLKVDLKDYFSFDLKFDKDMPGWGRGGQRYIITAKLDDIKLSTFQLDVTIEERTILPRETVKGHSLLDFAGIERPVFKVAAKEEVFADKIHAYTRIHESTNTRVKDLNDMCKLIDRGLDQTKVKNALHGVFADKRAHNLPRKLSAPPEEWQSEFDEIAKRTKLNMTLEEAYIKISNYYDNALCIK